MRDEVVILETNIDDSSAEELGFCLKRLLKMGALDAFFTPIVMKKSRPAYSLTVICKPEEEEELVKIIFKHTGSVGLRRRVSERIIMDREKTKVETPYGVVDANKFTYEDIEKISLEFDSVKKLAKKKNIGITGIYKNYKEL
ncbi:MAG: LarC family nickel insertion protein [Ruminococcaceae bacterium]|nr:LarC family nickel insertion protein [Oscillospiraceae bacterium]